MWSWDFGDAIGTSPLMNPAYIYTGPGTYTVCLTATNTISGDSYTYCKDVTVTCNTTASFIADQTYFCGSGTVNLINTSVGAATFKWYEDNILFDSLNSVTLRTFTTVGTYVIKLIVFDVFGCSDSSSTTIYVSDLADAGFTSTEVSWTVYEFSPNKADGISWIWYFGDGDTSSLEKPSHDYGTGGVYNACLVMTNACGTDSVCNTISIICDSISGAWTVSITNATASFTDQSVNADTWFWDFDDGSTSVQPNPFHTYTDDGVYNVCQRASNYCDSRNICQEVTIKGTGINDTELSRAIRVFPNPTNSTWNVAIELAKKQTVTFELFSLLGAMLYQTQIENISTGVFRLNVKDLPEGIYYLNVSTEQGSIQKKLLIM